MIWLALGWMCVGALLALGALLIVWDYTAPPPPPVRRYRHRSGRLDASVVRDGITYPSGSLRRLMESERAS